MRGPVIADILGRHLQLAAREPVERLQEEEALHHLGHAEPEWIAANEVRELVRQHAALLLLAEIGHHRLGQADLPPRQCHGTGEAGRRSEPDIVRVTGGEAERLEQVAQALIGDLAPPTDALHETDTTRRRARAGGCRRCRPRP